MAVLLLEAGQDGSRADTKKAVTMTEGNQPGQPVLAVLPAAPRCRAGPGPMSSTAGWAMPGVALKRMRGSAAGRCRGAPRSRSTRSSAMSTSALWPGDVTH